MYKSPVKKKIVSFTMISIHVSSIYPGEMSDQDRTSSVWQLEEYQVRLTIPERNDHLGVATKDVTNSEQW